MRKQKTYQITENFTEKFLEWGNSFNIFSFLSSNNFYDSHLTQTSYNTFEIIAAVDTISDINIEINSGLNNDSFESLKRYHENTKDWLFGYLTYDLKNETELLKSENHDEIKFPEIHFFQPKYIFIFHNNHIDILYVPTITSDQEIDDLYQSILNTAIPHQPEHIKLCINNRFSKDEYIFNVEELIQHIKLGDIYEVNFCHEFFAENVEINALNTFNNLINISPTPFSCFYKYNNKYLLCASPERYLKKTGNKIISQPIKGTARRGNSLTEDEQIKIFLLNDKKENAENIMIVDLVRNDLSRTAAKNSVHVEELCGLYSFSHVHQLISTVVSELGTEYHFTDAIKNSFPMGSMTGAPKISAMKLIEKFEKTKRGLYSGSVGYITPEGDFDLNVVIRSILYNATEKYLSFSVGGAITAKSDPGKEYEECLVKAEAILKTIS